MALFVVIALMLTVSFTSTPERVSASQETAVVLNGQGEIAGEVTTNSVVLQSRLIAVNGLVDDSKYKSAAHSSVKRVQIHANEYEKTASQGSYIFIGIIRRLDSLEVVCRASRGGRYDARRHGHALDANLTIRTGNDRGVITRSVLAFSYDRGQ